MAGLARICKEYGGIIVNGVEWVYDYAQDKPRLKSEMTKEEMIKSERARWLPVKIRTDDHSF